MSDLLLAHSPPHTASCALGLPQPVYMQSVRGRTLQVFVTSLRSFRGSSYGPRGSGCSASAACCSALQGGSSSGGSTCSQSKGLRSGGVAAKLHSPGRSHAQALVHAVAAAAQPPPPSGLVLGIESSCDDTGVAVMTPDGQILGQALATQADVHRQWGGVVPTLAKEAHAASIDATVDEALAQARVSAADLAAIAVTVGPGLLMCLHVGVRKAMRLSAETRVPLVGVHHMEAHALIARSAAACADVPGGQPKFPFLAMLVSGGHNLLLVVRGVGDYQQLGTTLDDAAGEAFDKVARMLGLDANGAHLEALAREGNPTAYPLSVPMSSVPTCDMSYAGLKTQVMRLVEVAGVTTPTDANRQVRADIAASFQAVAVQHLQQKCKRAIVWARETCPDITSLVVSGGVACNKSVRSSLQALADSSHLRLVVPPPALCTDNGAMIAWAGQERLALGLWVPPPTLEQLEDSNLPFEARAGWLHMRPRWPLTNDNHHRALDRKAYTRKKILRLHTSLRELTAAALAGVPPEEVALQQPPEEDEPSDPLVLPGRMKRTSQARKNKAAAQQAARQADSSAGAAAEQAAQQPAAQAVV